jgi:hypothetical protein
MYFPIILVKKTVLFFILFNCLFFSQNGSGCFLQISTHCPLAAYMLKVLQISLLTALGKMLSALQKGTAY